MCVRVCVCVCLCVCHCVCVCLSVRQTHTDADGRCSTHGPQCMEALDDPTQRSAPCLTRCLQLLRLAPHVGPLAREDPASPSQVQSRVQWATSAHLPHDLCLQGAQRRPHCPLAERWSRRCPCLQTTTAWTASLDAPSPSSHWMPPLLPHRVLHLAASGHPLHGLAVALLLAVAASLPPRREPRFQLLFPV
jgi:hypothetical protein